MKDDAKLSETLHELSKPDLTAPPEIGFVHRTMMPYEAYFLVNTANHRVHSAVKFTFSTPFESWDPFTGKTKLLEPVGRPEVRALDLDLAPYESRIILCFFRGDGGYGRSCFRREVDGGSCVWRPKGDSWAWPFRAGRPTSCRAGSKRRLESNLCRFRATGDDGPAHFLDGGCRHEELLGYGDL